MECKGEDIYDVEKVRQPRYKYVTVEPSMFFYMMAFMVTTVFEQNFFVFRACTVNHGYSEEVCYNISSYVDINKEVQKTTSIFHQWNGIANHIAPLVLAFFLGSYSDKRGRKILIVAGMLGKLFYSIMFTLNTMNAWPVEYLIFTATFPCALTGADLAIFAGCFAYVADVSSMKNRSLRVGILDAVYMSTMPTGIAIGNVLFYKVFDKSFTAIFAVNSGLMVIATAYSILCLDWQTRIEQKSLKEAGVKNPITDFFSSGNIKQTIVTLTKQRPGNRRLFLWFLLISMVFYTFQRDEKQVMYLYTTNVFKWDANDFSHFRTYLSTAYVLLMLLGIPLMTKLFNWRDTIIIMVGAASHICGHLIYANATAETTMYIGASAAALGPCVVPLLRAMASKVLPPAEKGVAYAFLSVMEKAVGLVASIVYSQIYNATLDTSPNTFFYFTVATQVAVFLLAMAMECMLKGGRIESYLDQDERRISKTST
ncbi:lysosomal proton-coupled steroid conjugate and bile acid symporter SLC46A3 [Epargyreus clarus]|uniref:lysosomal proton-coupled steroid conjugate and bile acid symporter SLC46A3 n=1 Tax=Epargyreus clarus TaxID=520877 RepID=UPI003C2D0D9D